MDFYTLLSLARTATEGEIERAYRRLARRYHPGINPGDAMAAEMFRQIEQAYRVLSDAEQRREYDQGTARPSAPAPEASVSFTGFDFSAPVEGPYAATFSELFADVFQDAAREATTPSRGASIEIGVTVAFEDAVQGGQVPISVLRQERCPGCAGHGIVARAAGRCPACGGQGSRRWARGHMVFTTACERCDGRGQLSTDRCRLCAGVGVQARSEVVTLTIPPGLEDGARVAVPGRGHTGARGGPAGDLYVTVSVGSHPFLRRAGRDLVLTLPVAVHEAALGAKVDVPTLDGPARVRSPPGAASGQRLRVGGHGVPAPVPGGEPGDLLVEVQIVLPPVRDERSKELLREFARLNDVDVRAHLRLNGR
jgi:molecular chaperone DnaJ